MITIPIELISMKNSKEIFEKNRIKTKIVNGKESVYVGKSPFIASSKASRINKNMLIDFMRKEENRKLWDKEKEGKQKPYRLFYFLYRKTDRHFDYNNITQVLFDAMQFSKWLKDDDMRNLIPIPMGWEKDSQNPRIEISVLGYEKCKNILTQ